MRSSSDSCGTEGQIDCAKDKKRECNPCSGKNSGMKDRKLFVIGTGPGDLNHISRRAIELLQASDCVAGYTTYIDLIKDVIKDKKIISTGMTKEVDRVELAIDEALKGNSCSIVSGGDAGIYAMAGLVFEICQKRGIRLIRHGSENNSELSNSTTQDLAFERENCLELEVVPGIPALAAGASLLGAPLTHDFAVISLSDLLTSWEKIEKRISAAAAADFVIVIYNPKSRKRDWQLKRAKELIMAHRDGDTPVGVVTSAMREEQKITISTLKDMDIADVGMQTILFVGNESSIQYLDFMFTPRGYSEKYEI
ncbi:MAG: precorrin-3B C(17)-methyltransferase [Desulfamplus sp.]|nr:precorrin-3B C(17)-methyltransferase [Desulfamplus sp.]